MKSPKLAAIVLLAISAGCTVHPDGERAERQASIDAGNAYKQPIEDRKIAALADPAMPDDLVRYALLNNADLERQYWRWRSAIEQIPIDGTQASNLSISLGTVLNNGKFAADRTSIGAGNDPMADLVLPGKLSAAARRSLENARAEGMRFRKGQFELRRKVWSAYDDIALDAEMIRLSEREILILQTTAVVTESRSRSGMGGLQEVLRAGNELDMARNDLENLRAQSPIFLAALNALLNRPPASAVNIGDSLPPERPLAGSDAELLDRAGKMNPELIAQADEIRAGREQIHLARLQYIPDFSLAASTDLQGMAQSLLGSVTIPVLRADALDAAVKQAQANLNAAEAMRRQSASDLAAQLFDDIATLRDADRQLQLLRKTILPRAKEAVELARSAYQTGQAALTDLLDAQRSLIDIDRLIANLQVVRDKRLAQIESIDAMPML